MSVTRWRTAVVAALVATSVSGCGAAAGPEQPTPSSTPIASFSDEPSPSVSAQRSLSTSPSAGATPSPASPSAAASGPTLRQLGFENGPLDEFSIALIVELW